MRIQLVSDLHMEFAPIEIANAGADTLVLSGDICVAEYFDRAYPSPYAATAASWLHWFEHTCAQFTHVIYILGNHEHYMGNFYKTTALLKRTLGHIPNLHILDNELVVLDGIRFFGTTLWTDFDHDNFKAMMVRDGLNDYKVVTGQNYRKLTTAETAYYNGQAVQMIQDARPDVVVGHHAPSYRSVRPEYLFGAWAKLNPGYCSHLDKIVEATGTKLWTHGHVHSSHDYEIGSTRVVANPRGYAQKSGTNENENFNPNLVLEI